MDPKINLRGMIRLDDVKEMLFLPGANSNLIVLYAVYQVEDLLTNVLRRLDAQDTLIAKLTNTLQTLMPVDIARECVSALFRYLLLICTHLSSHIPL